MKKILFLLVLCTPVIAFSYNNNNIKGYWREISRKNSTNHYVHFQDTMKVEFMQGNECIWQETGGYAYRSTYSIEPTGIDLGFRFFNILYNDGNYLVLGDIDGIYKFKRYKTNNNTARWTARDYPAHWQDANNTAPQKHDNNEPVYTPQTPAQNDYDQSYYSRHTRTRYRYGYTNSGTAKKEETYYTERQKRDDEYYPKQPVHDKRFYPHEQNSEIRNYPRRERGELTGNWREISRRNINNRYINFSDTILIDFLQGNEYVWHKKGSFIYRGTYIKDANTIDIGMRYFNIISNEGNYLVLSDGTGIYEFEYYIPDPYDPGVIKPEVYAPVHNIQQMAGHWSVFKRTSTYRPNEIDYTRQLKMVDFYSHQEDGAWGDFFSQRDADNAPSWYVEHYANQTVYLNGRDRREFHVIKCEDNELIMESEGVTYYFRQFR
jgi:hypothetical protein